MGYVQYWSNIGQLYVHYKCFVNHKTRQSYNQYNLGHLNNIMHGLLKMRNHFDYPMRQVCQGLFKHLSRVQGPLEPAIVHCNLISNNIIDIPSKMVSLLDALIPQSLHKTFSPNFFIHTDTLY